MAFDFTADNLIDAGGGLLFFALGILVLGVGRRSALTLSFGAFATTFGALFFSINFWIPNDPSHRLFLAFPLQTAAAVSAGLLVWLLGRQVSDPTRKWWYTFLVCDAVALAVALTGLWNGREEYAPNFFVKVPSAELTVLLFAFPVWTMWAVMAAVVATAAFVHRSATEPGERRAMAGLALAIGVYLTFYLFDVAGSRLGAIGAVAQVAVPMAAICALSALAWVVATDGPDPRRARNVALALFATAALGFVVGSLALPFANAGGPGLARTVGAVFAGIALFRHDLFGVSLPKMRSATLGGAAVAVLLIVAQVAQNFLTAEYGLVMGGIIAGAFLFAAAPIQRAIERAAHTDQALGQPHGLRTDVDASARREQSYLDAVRLALRDRRLTRQEESKLTGLAENLGIGAKRAHELLVQAETEAGVA